MTTVAWDGKVLAADTLLVDSCGLYEDVEKIFDISPRGVLAYAGDYANGLHLVELARRQQIEIFPAYDDLTAIWAMPGEPAKRLVCGKQGSFFIPIMRDAYAIGSGRDYALMAMHLGKSATGAVRLAALFDRYTSPTVVAWSLENGEARRVQ
jgi:hypothetical protein